MSIKFPRFNVGDKVEILPESSNIHKVAATIQKVNRTPDDIFLYVVRYTEPTSNHTVSVFKEDDLKSM